MDPLVDKIMLAAAFISLVPLKAVPAWAATTVVARDFLITGLRLMASAKGRILPAESLGKHKTSWQVITSAFFSRSVFSKRTAVRQRRIGMVAARVESGRPDSSLDHRGFNALLGLAYAWRHRELIAPDQ